MSDPVPAQEIAPGHKVFAGNLAYSVTEDALKAFFAPVENDIISVQVIMRGTRSAGYGFVTVQSLESAQKACEQLDKKDLEGRQVVIEVAKPAEQKDKERAERRAKRRDGRARGRAPPGEVTEAEANGDLEKSADGLNDASGNDAEGLDSKRKPKKKRFARKKGKKNTEATAVESTEAPESAAVEGEAAKRQRTPRVKRAPRAVGEEPQGEPSKTVLFVANLGFNIDDAGLTQLFKDADINVVSARIVRRRWGKPRKSKGYGFVDVGGEDEQKKAIAALEGKDIEGRQLTVKVAVNAGHEDGHDEEDIANGKDIPEAQAASA